MTLIAAKPPGSLSIEHFAINERYESMPSRPRTELFFSRVPYSISANADRRLYSRF
jgi:hypothetical protein